MAIFHYQPFSALNINPFRSFIWLLPHEFMERPYGLLPGG